ncbi:MAG: hypothetical protein ABI183_13220 [Polyangiaceae bacterium]
MTRTQKVQLASLGIVAIVAACGGGGGDADPSSVTTLDDGGTQSEASSSDPDATVKPTGDAGSSDAGDPFDLDPTVNYKSGSRLRARVFSGGGRRIFRWFEDTQYARCTAQTAEDGQLHCMPDLDSTAAADVYYIDAACTLRVEVSDPTVCADAPTPPAVSLPSTTLLGQVQGYTLSAPLSGTTTFYKNVGGGLCHSIPAPTGQIRRVGSTIPAASFVMLHATEVGAGRIHSTGFTADDGASYIDAKFFDVQSDKAICSVGRDATNTTRCFPSTDIRDYDNTWSDSTCTQTRVISLTSPGPYVLELQQGANDCLDFYDARPVTGAYSGQTYLSGPCTPFVTATSGYYSLGPVTPATTFAEIDYVHRGAGRLARNEATQGGTEWVLPVNQEGDTGLFDTTTNAACRPLRAASGQWFCGIIGYDLSSPPTYYLDAKCTQMAVSKLPCDTATTFTIQDTTKLACGSAPTYRTFQLGPSQASAPSYGLNAGGTCVSTGTATDVRPFTALMPATDFQALTDRLE